MKKRGTSNWYEYCAQRDIRGWDGELFKKEYAKINLYEALSMANAIEVAITSKDWPHYVRSHRWHYPYFRHYEALGITRQNFEERRLKVLRNAWEKSAFCEKINYEYK